MLNKMRVTKAYLNYILSININLVMSENPVTGLTG